MAAELEPEQKSEPELCTGCNRSHVMKIGGAGTEAMLMKRISSEVGAGAASFLRPLRPGRRHSWNESALMFVFDDCWWCCLQSLGNNRFPSRNFHPVYAECKFLRIPNYAVVAFTLRIPPGLYMEANVIDMPLSVKDCLISLDTEHLALSLFQNRGKIKHVKQRF